MWIEETKIELFCYSVLPFQTTPSPLCTHHALEASCTILRRGWTGERRARCRVSQTIEDRLLLGENHFNVLEWPSQCPDQNLLGNPETVCCLLTALKPDRSRIDLGGGVAQNHCCIVRKSGLGVSTWSTCPHCTVSLWLLHHCCDLQMKWFYGFHCFHKDFHFNFPSTVSSADELFFCRFPPVNWLVESRSWLVLNIIILLSLHSNLAINQRTGKDSKTITCNIRLCTIVNTCDFQSCDSQASYMAFGSDEYANRIHLDTCMNKCFKWVKTWMKREEDHLHHTLQWTDICNETPDRLAMKDFISQKVFFFIAYAILQTFEVTVLWMRPLDLKGW